jgi:hypothetical protein
MIPGGESRRLMLPSTATRDDSNVACERTSDRIERMRAEEAMRPKQAPVDARTAEYHKELAARDAKAKADKNLADAKALACGELIIAIDGTRVRKLPSGRYELYD